MTASEYTTIMHLSELPNRELRMADWPAPRPFGESDDRLVDDLQSRGLVPRRRAHPTRGATLQGHSPGLDEMKSAWPVHLASVAATLDCIDARDVERAVKYRVKPAAVSKMRPDETASATLEPSHQRGRVGGSTWASDRVSRPIAAHRSMSFCFEHEPHNNCLPTKAKQDIVPKVVRIVKGFLLEKGAVWLRSLHEDGSFHKSNSRRHASY